MREKKGLSLPSHSSPLSKPPRMTLPSLYPPSDPLCHGPIIIPERSSYSSLRYSSVNAPFLSPCQNFFTPFSSPFRPATEKEFPQKLKTRGKVASESERQSFPPSLINMIYFPLTSFAFQSISRDESVRGKLERPRDPRPFLTDVNFHFRWRGGGWQAQLGKKRAQRTKRLFLSHTWPLEGKNIWKLLRSFFAFASHFFFSQKSRKMFLSPVLSSIPVFSRSSKRKKVGLLNTYHFLLPPQTNVFPPREKETNMILSRE